MIKAILSLILLLGFLLPCGVPAEAASMSAFIDADAYAEVGSEFKVTVRFESDTGAMVRAVLQYDSSVVTFLRTTSSDANDVGGTVNIVTLSFQTTHEIELYFQMNQEAPAAFSAQVLESSTIDMGSLGTPYASCTVTGFYPTPEPVTPEPTPAPTPTPTPFIPTVDPEATPSTPLEFMENGEMRFIADNFSEESVPIPEGFEKVQYNYKGSEIFVLKNTYEVVMIYATNIVGEEGRFYIYNESRDILTPYTEFVLGSNVYTFLIPAEALPEGFTETSVSIGEYENVTAYAIANPDYADFVLVYAFNRTNEPGFYLYDTAEGTLQRCVDETLLGAAAPSPTGSVSPSPTLTVSPARTPVLQNTSERGGKMDTNTLILVVLGVCLAAALAAVIIIIVRKRRIEQSEEEENDVEFLEDIILEKSLNQEQPQEREEPAAKPESAPLSSEPSEEPQQRQPQKEPEPQENAKEQERNSDKEDDDDVLQLGNHFPR